MNASDVIKMFLANIEKRATGALGSTGFTRDSLYPRAFSFLLNFLLNKVGMLNNEITREEHLADAYMVRLACENPECTATRGLVSVVLQETEIFSIEERKKFLPWDNKSPNYQTMSNPIWSDYPDQVEIYRILSSNPKF